MFSVNKKVVFKSIWGSILTNFQEMQWGKGNESPRISNSEKLKVEIKIRKYHSLSAQDRRLIIRILLHYSLRILHLAPRINILAISAINPTGAQPDKNREIFLSIKRGNLKSRLFLHDLVNLSLCSCQMWSSHPIREVVFPKIPAFCAK